MNLLSLNHLNCIIRSIEKIELAIYNELVESGTNQCIVEFL
jgi:hypothetical protein